MRESRAFWSRIGATVIVLHGCLLVATRRLRDIGDRLWDKARDLPSVARGIHLKRSTTSIVPEKQAYDFVRRIPDF